MKKDWCYDKFDVVIIICVFHLQIIFINVTSSSDEPHLATKDKISHEMKMDWLQLWKYCEFVEYSCQRFACLLNTLSRLFGLFLTIRNISISHCTLAKCRVVLCYFLKSRCEVIVKLFLLVLYAAVTFITRFLCWSLFSLLWQLKTRPLCGERHRLR